jgi:hypothetical protein
VLHVLGDLAKAWHTDQIADAAAQHYVYDEAPGCVSPERWAGAACVLIEADTLDAITGLGLPRRCGVVVIAHDLDDGSIYWRAAGVGAEKHRPAARRGAHRHPHDPAPPQPHPGLNASVAGTSELSRPPERSLPMTVDTTTYLADAIRDGFLVDITEAARKVGFVVPVAITQDVRNDCIAWTQETQDRKASPRTAKPDACTTSSG